MFSIHKDNGETVALVADVLDAQRINRQTPEAHRVIRVSDGALIAEKRRRLPSLTKGALS